MHAAATCRAPRCSAMVWMCLLRRIGGSARKPDPNIKSHNYLNLVMADLEIRDRAPHAWAMLLDTRGFVSEGIGSNVFFVKDGELLTPKADYVLPGVSRAIGA